MAGHFDSGDPPGSGDGCCARAARGSPSAGSAKDPARRASKRLRGESAGGDDYPHKEAWYADVQKHASVKGKDALSGDARVVISVVVLESSSETESDSDSDSDGGGGAGAGAKKTRKKKLLKFDPGPTVEPGKTARTSTERWHEWDRRRGQREVDALVRDGVVNDIRAAFGNVVPKPVRAALDAAEAAARLLAGDLEVDNELRDDLLQAVVESKKAGAAGGPRQAARYLACYTYLEHVRGGKGLVAASEAAAKPVFPGETKSGRKTGSRIRDWLCTFKVSKELPLPNVHKYPMAFRNLIYDDEIRDLCMEVVDVLNGTGRRKKKWSASAFMTGVVNRLHAERPGVLPLTKSISTKTISFWLRELGMEPKDNQKGLYKVHPPLNLPPRPSRPDTDRPARVARPRTSTSARMLSRAGTSTSCTRGVRWSGSGRSARSFALPTAPNAAEKAASRSRTSGGSKIELMAAPCTARCREKWCAAFTMNPAATRRRGSGSTGAGRATTCTRKQRAVGWSWSAASSVRATGLWRWRQTTSKTF
jgi:hypothetical protein